ncbi:hypothetical protein [Amycolatopsis sp. NPDC051903]|uniref:hypothetical protein n=1 Tax=Amycolatopsis sp. NPDC051903 TaxID=3363936 RepID=UPI0037B4A074
MTTPDPGQVAGLDPKAIAAATAETTKLVNAAKSGRFSISGEALEQLRKALSDMVTRVDGLTGSTAALDQAPQLGSHPYGHAVAYHDLRAASESTGSLRSVLGQFRDLLAQADEALAHAGGAYRGAESAAVDLHSVRRAGDLA